EGVWIHDTKDVGIAVRQVLGSASATVRSSLVERAGGGAGVVAAGSSVTLDHVELRGTLPAANGQSGVGAMAESDPMAPGRALLTVIGSFVHDVRAQGISAEGADLAVEATLVRDVQPQSSDMSYGRCIDIETDPATSDGSTATITSAAFEACHE